MKLPGFKTSMYLGFALCLACLCSPFGWGVTHHPYPWANFLLSFSYYGMVILAGIRLIQSLRRSSVAAKGLMITLGVFLVITAAFFGGASMLVQPTSSHHQYIVHMQIVLVDLVVLACIVFLKAIEERARRRIRPLDDGNAAKPPIGEPPP